ncbi:DUF6777 domain-containing protein [Streptomyces sp. NPDC006704]|uniref:DUF6777 domain-containing protein n=1 Tax=Streptomyces sp. NPDC006704 TaxID=3364760 RepID=UPI00367C8CE2
MSVEPPSSGRPTGPPSGPLSGPSQPSPGGPGDTQAGATRADSTPPPGTERPSGPPSSGPPSGSDGGGGHGGGRGDGPDEPGAGSGAGHGPSRPWWKSAPRVAALSAAVVAAVVLAVVLTRPDGSSKGSSAAGGEVLLQPAAKTGPAPFTDSTARDSAPASPIALPSSSASANVTRGVDGAAPGLYGGTRNVTSCDVEKQIGALQKDPAKNKVFASVLGVEPSGVPGYLRLLTPVRLRLDTRVTNHGYRDGAATSYQAVLQAGTAVLVDDRGLPRVRCACGNPLLPPVAQKGTPKRTGEAWPGYQPSNVVVVAPAAQVVNKFVVYDSDHGAWFERHKGDTGSGDTKTQPPVTGPSLSPSSPSESPSGDESPSPARPSPCASLSGGPSSAKSCPPASSPPSSPATQPPSSPATHPPSSPASRPPSSAASSSSASASEKSPASSEPAPPSSPGAGGGS